MQINEPDAQKKILDEALEKAASIKKNQELLDKAIDSDDKHKLIEAITTVTGNDQDDLRNMPTADIIDLARRMYDKSMHYDEMIKQCNEYKKVLTERNEDYYREVFLDIDYINRTEGLEAGELLARRENGYSYIRKALDIDDISEETLNTLDDDALYKLVSNIGIIKYLNDSASSLNAGKDDNRSVRDVLSNLSDEDFESIGMNVNDYDKAVNEIQSMNLGNELSEGIKNIIKSDVPVQKLSDFEGN